MAKDPHHQRAAGSEPGSGQRHVAASSQRLSGRFGERIVGAQQEQDLFFDVILDAPYLDLIAIDERVGSAPITVVR
jgi:hypothetical protein